jgi:hypothetical protein
MVLTKNTKTVVACREPLKAEKNKRKKQSEKNDGSIKTFTVAFDSLTILRIVDVWQYF